MFGDDALKFYDRGWRWLTPTKPSDKRPEKSGWPSAGKSDPQRDDIAADARRYRTHGIGLCYGPANPTIGMDIDILDDAIASAARDICENILGVTPLIRQGLPPKLLMLYRKALPFEIAGKFFGAFEVFSRVGSQTVIAGIHPDTLQPYRWIAGASPTDTTPDELPAVTPEQVYAAIDALGAMVNRSGYRAPQRVPQHQPRQYKSTAQAAHQRPSLRQRGASDRTSGAMAAVLPKLRATDDPLIEATRLAATADYGSRYSTATGLIYSLVAMGYDDGAIERAVIAPYLDHFTNKGEKHARTNAIASATTWARATIGADECFRDDGAPIAASLAEGW